MANSRRYSLFCDMIDKLDAAYGLIAEYDAQLHNYNGVILYQAETEIITLVGHFPGISAAECADKLKKTISACSQLIKKLKAKGWVRQVRNELNNRIYNLYLTDEGKEIYKRHKKFEDSCYKRTFKLLDGITEDEFRTYIKIQQRLNEGFLMDVEDSRNLSIQQSLEKKA